MDAGDARQASSSTTDDTTSSERSPKRPREKRIRNEIEAAFVSLVAKEDTPKRNYSEESGLSPIRSDDSSFHFEPVVYSRSGDEISRMSDSQDLETAIEWKSDEEPSDFTDGEQKAPHNKSRQE